VALLMIESVMTHPRSNQVREPAWSLACLDIGRRPNRTAER
jgi:hypothetical protein